MALNRSRSVHRCVKTAAQQAFEAQMESTRPACNSNMQIIVTDDIYDDFVKEMTSPASSVQPSDPAEKAAIPC